MSGRKSKKQRKLFREICKRHDETPSMQLYRIYVKNLKKEGLLTEFIRESRKIP